MLRIYILILTIITILPMLCHAQDYGNSAGFRSLGGTSGFTYKNNINDDQAMEFMLGFGGKSDGVQVYGIYQWYRHIDLPFTKNLFLTYGIGGHTGYGWYYRERYYYVNDDLDYLYETGRQAFYTIGIVGDVGLEYRIYSVPLTVGLDVMPRLSYYGFKYMDYNAWDAGFSVKYIF